MTQRRACGPLVLALLASSTPAAAQPVTWGFEPSEGYAPGTLDAQPDGGTSRWAVTGAYVQAVTDAGARTGAASWRFSNQFVNGNVLAVIGPRAMVLGEPDAGTGAGTHAGPNDNHLELTFSFRTVSAINDSSQAAIGVSDTFASRLVLARLRSLAGGVSINDAYSGALVVSGLPFGVWHDVRVSADFVQGPSNDQVRWYINGGLRATTGSWEAYYQSVARPPPAVDGVIFSSDVIAGAVNAGGMLFDDISYGPTPPDAGTAADGGAPDGGSADGGAPDGGTVVDGGAPDSGTAPDGGTAPDAGTVPDAGTAPDAGPLDAGSSGGPVAHLPVGCGCDGPSGADALVLAALLAILWPRRRAQWKSVADPFKSAADRADT